jgi:hypothetical protein
MSQNITELRIILFARSIMGIAKDKEFIDWAISELIEGNETESIKILAGFESPYNPFEFQEYINKCKKELLLNFEETKLIDQYAFLLANQKLKEEISSKEIADKMYEIVKFTKYNSKYFAWFEINEFFDDYYVISDKKIEEVIKIECENILKNRFSNPSEGTISNR